MRCTSNPARCWPSPTAAGAYHPDIEGLENTLRAFQHAVELGYDYLETDVHVTQDGVLLAFHDSVLDRVTDATGAIATRTYAEVQRALINGSDPVPTLADLFDAFPDALFNIDLKAPGAVRAAGPVPRRARGLGPGLRRVVLGPTAAPLPPPQRGPRGDVRIPGEVAAYRVLPSSVARFVTRGRPRVLQVPHQRGPAHDRHPGARPPRPPGGCPGARLDHRRPRGDEDLLDLGVDGLMTDRTDILRAVLTESGRWRTRR
jgi:glycerophosphoryl diester phosphodiesterase